MIVMDNLTLQSALRVLNPDLGYPPFHVDRTTERKWDYALNRDLRSCVDLACLGQLVQNVVLFDKIGVSRNLLNSWYPANERSYWTWRRRPLWSDDEAPEIKIDPLELPEEFDGLSDILTVIDDGGGALWASNLGAATSQALKCVASDVFNGYVEMLSREGALGTFLDISNGYFETGYSDTGLFSDLDETVDFPELVTFMRGEAPDGQQLLRELESLKESGDSQEAGDLGEDIRRRVRRLMLVNAVNKVFLDAGSWGRSKVGRKESHVGDFFGIPVSGDNWVQKDFVHEDILRHLSATFYYQEVAGLHSASYMPHPLRAPFSLLGEYGESGGQGFGESQLLQTLEHLRACRARDVNRVISSGVPALPGLHVDVRIPFILTAVLADVNSSNTVMESALNLRNSRRVERLRTWFSDLRTELAENEIGMEDLQRRVEGLNRAVSRWWTDGSTVASATETQVTMGINVGIASLQLATKKNLPRLDFRGSRRLRFIQDLARISDATPTISPVISRVLGEDLGRAWNNGKEVFDRVVGMSRQYPILDPWGRNSGD